jgi:TetR/AcrR family transcriptional regulator, tetracycline repressor protein
MKEVKPVRELVCQEHEYLCTIYAVAELDARCDPCPAMARRRPGPQRRFSREELAERALAIMDAYGAEALTMRRLAAELGMSPMALYRYFPSKEELMDAAIEVAAPEVTLPEPGAGPWKEQLADLARAMFRAGLRHPSVARERFNRPLQTPRALHVTERAIALLLEAGLSKADAVAAFKALLVHSLGSAAFVAGESKPEVRESARKRHASLPADELPAMASVAGELTAALGGEQAFELGLAALLDGIELRAAH